MRKSLAHDDVYVREIGGRDAGKPWYTSLQVVYQECQALSIVASRGPRPGGGSDAMAGRRGLSCTLAVSEVRAYPTKKVVGVPGRARRNQGLPESFPATERVGGSGHRAIWNRSEVHEGRCVHGVRSPNEAEMRSQEISTRMRAR